MSTNNDAAQLQAQGQPSQSLTAAFVSVCGIFLMVGFSQFMTGIMVSYLQGLFSLTNFEAQLISLAFFAAYFLMALPAERLLSGYGYKRGIVVGLVICALGAALFIPASQLLQYWAFLGSVCVLGIGVATLQVGINPYVAVLGPESSAAARVSLANGCTALGAILAPKIGSALFLSDELNVKVTAALSPAQLLEKASIVQVPFLVVAAIFLVLAFVFSAMKLPEMKGINTAAAEPFSLSNYPWLILGIVGIFIYMGGQIGVINLFFLPYLQEKAGLTATEASTYLSYFFVLQMLGRFGGSALMTRYAAGGLLALSAAGMIGTIAAVQLMPGSAAPYLFALMGVFDALCFGNIFSLAIKGLGDATKKASSFLFMAVLGGAILPAVIGKVVDLTSMGVGLWAAAACYGYVFYYGLVGHKVGQKLA